MTGILEYFDNTIARDVLYTLIKGDLLGTGVARQVYRCAFDSSLVVKIETTSRSFQNVLEWEAWDAVRLTKYKDWFAPCVSISPCGTVLLQKYTRDLEPDEVPKDVPNFFCDLKVDNWGFYEGRPVCRDYGRTLLMDKGLSSKMKKADFW